MKCECEVIYTFKNGEQAFSEVVELDLRNEAMAKFSTLSVLERNGETRKLVKASIAILTGISKKELTTVLRWFLKCNGKLYFN